MQRALDARTVVVAERADALHHVVDVLVGDQVRRQHRLTAGQARLGLAAHVHDHFQQVASILEGDQRIADVGRQHLE